MQRAKENEETGKCVPNKKQDKFLETNLNEVEISDLSAWEFKIMVIKMLTQIRRAIREQSENFNSEMENIKKYQMEIIELKNTIT